METHTQTQPHSVRRATCTVAPVATLVDFNPWQPPPQLLFTLPTHTHTCTLTGSLRNPCGAPFAPKLSSRLVIEVKVTAKALAALIMLQHLYNFYLIYLKVAKMKHSLQHTENGTHTQAHTDKQTRAAQTRKPSVDLCKLW